MVGVPVDVFDRLLRRVDPHLGRTGERPGAVDDPGLPDARPELGAGIEARHPRKELVGVVRHVARTGYTRGEVEHAGVVAKVLVVVPQSWHEEAGARVHHLGPGRCVHVGIRAHAHDARAAHQHARARGDGKVARIEQPRVADQERACRLARLRARQLRRPGIARAPLCGGELRQQGLGRGRQHHEPAGDDRRGRPVAREPDRRGREVDSADTVLNWRAIGWRVCQGTHAFDRRLARRQQRQAVLRRLEERARQHAQELRRRIHRQVEGAPGGSFPLLEAVVPAHLCARHVQRLAHRHLHVVVPGA